MNRLAEIYQELMDKGVLVKTGSYHLKGKCDSVCVSDGKHYGIFLDIEKVRTLAQELEAVSHEWAHIDTGALYTLDAPYHVRRKAEVKADRAQIRKVIPFADMDAAIRAGLHEWYELADYFGVSEVFVHKAYEYYTGPCGLTFAA
jgi:hypothetical protein